MDKQKVEPPILVELLQDFPPFPIDYVECGEEGEDFIGGIGGKFKNPHSEDTTEITCSIGFVKE